MSTLAELLASLPEEQRIILTAHYLRGKSSAEIAAMLGVPQKAVETVIALGKAELLKALK
jgi:RNA polymerase sigma factor (sigma-70 family)